jgi:hypothetical protein
MIEVLALAAHCRRADDGAASERLRDTVELPSRLLASSRREPRQQPMLEPFHLLADVVDDCGLPPVQG